MDRLREGIPALSRRGDSQTIHSEVLSHVGNLAEHIVTMGGVVDKSLWLAEAHGPMPRHGSPPQDQGFARHKSQVSSPGPGVAHSPAMV